MIQLTEEQARELLKKVVLYKDKFSPYRNMNMLSIEQTLSHLKHIGYIKKSALEELECYIRDEMEYYSNDGSEYKAVIFSMLKKIYNLHRQAIKELQEKSE